jgi:hypothetical protein
VSLDPCYLIYLHTSFVPFPICFLNLLYSILVHSCIFDDDVILILLLSTITILSFRIILNLTFSTLLYSQFALSSLLSSLYLPLFFHTCLFSKSFLRFHLYPRFLVIFFLRCSLPLVSSHLPFIHSSFFPLNSLPFPLSRSFVYSSLKLSSSLLFSMNCPISLINLLHFHS